MQEIWRVALYLIIALIVIYIFITITTGIEPLTLIKRIGQTFEAGQLKVENDKDGSVASVDCKNNYVVTLNKPKFSYKPKSGEESISFIIFLDFGASLKPGAHSNGQTIMCSIKEGDTAFTCPQELKLEFDMGPQREEIRGPQVLHFTAWRAQPVIDAANRQGETLNNLLENYPDAYISSFDFLLDFTIECRESECGRKSSREECTGDCYVRGGEIGPFWSCKACPDSTDCRRYDGDACTRCSWAIKNCQTSAISLYQRCSAK